MDDDRPYNLMMAVAIAGCSAFGTTSIVVLAWLLGVRINMWGALLIAFLLTGIFFFFRVGLSPTSGGDEPATSALHTPSHSKVAS